MISLAVVRFDFSRLPTERERKALTIRRDRLTAAQKTRTVAVANLGKLSAERELTAVRVRDGFVRLPFPLVDDTSDRSAPAPEHRPTSTRLMTPNGIGLRLMLIALFEAQSRTAPGTRADGTPIPLHARVGSGRIGWTTLLSSSAQPAGDGKYRMSVVDKQMRQLQTTFTKLEREGLIEPADPKRRGRGRYEGFFLRYENIRSGETGDRYRVPDSEDPYFDIPVSLFTNGWIHVLEDSELALLLITIRMYHRHGAEPQKLAAGTRLLHYGLSRDATESHLMLTRLGLIESHGDPARTDHGKVTDYKNIGAQPHEFLFLPAGLDRDASTTTLEEIQFQLDRETKGSARSIADAKTT
ncbi:hypothetical protein PNF1_690 (plasmid) [Nocardia farcinica IFM 10152]|uniref:Uncharacterized protein n=1 Tax=Nocardia farcinica (strain IFM 10152) TaxID=247156 RepID=Q5YMJ6_NOCFA|nr:hypothetical protein PNF1_690 [Nocardia farcinica IFM 10152]